MSVTAKSTGMSQKDFLALYIKNHGRVLKTCEEAHVGVGTFYNWKKDAKFKAQIDEVEGITLDFVEGCLLDNVHKCSESSTFFYLKKKGKSKGYAEATPNDFINIPEWRDAKTPDQKLAVIDCLLADNRITPSQAQAMGAYVNVAYNIEASLDQMRKDLDQMRKYLAKGGFNADE